jgi:clan AA aspartic protease
MGLVYANIELINSGDVEVARRGFIKKNEIRKAKVKALVDSGAYMLCINQSLKEQLGLAVIDTQVAELANGIKERYEIVGPVEVIFENRSTSCRALVLPGDAEVLLGAIPIEDMDVIIDPKDQKLKVHPLRPYIAQKSLK